MTVQQDIAAERRPGVALESTAALAAPAAALFLLASLAAVLWGARDWPLVHDASIMHYIVFLMDHGFAPYRDIPDLNMPGSYMAESFVMHTFGGDAAAWRLWDLNLGLLCIGACAWICGPGFRWAGVAGGVLAYLVHLTDGPRNLGQRDWLVAVLLLGALGSLLSAQRRGRPAWIGLASLLCGLAATVKPHALLVGFGFFIAICWLNRPQVRSSGPPIRGGLPAVAGWSIVGMIPPAAMTIGFLTYWQAWPAFLGAWRGLIPWYVGTHSAQMTLGGMLAFGLWAQVLLAGFLTASWPDRRERNFDLELVYLGVLGGFGLFLVQGKGWDYHRYTEVVFLSLWGALAFARVMSRGRVGQVAGIAGLSACAIFGLSLISQATMMAYPARNLPELERDLQRLGGSALSGKVQCLDMVLGSCISALYDLKLVSATGIIGDPGLFPEHPSPAVAPYQRQFAEVLAKRPPRVIVISPYSWPADTFDYRKLRNWPLFEAALAKQYRLARDVPNIYFGPGYRIYVLKGSNGPAL